MSDRDQAVQTGEEPDVTRPAGPGDQVAGPHGDPLAGELAPDADVAAADDPSPPAPAPAANEGEEAQASGADAAAAPEVAADLEQLKALAGERDEYLALAQRAQADFDNYRKRMARETALAMDRGTGRLAKELLPALDHLELALRAAESEGGELLKGVRMVQGEMLGALGRVGIEAFSPTGEVFDPNEHEAMVQRPEEGAESGTVIEVYQQGYRLNGTVLRPARVVVAA